jgi:hypothetical protein
MNTLLEFFYFRFYGWRWLVFAIFSDWTARKLLLRFPIFLSIRAKRSRIGEIKSELSESVTNSDSVTLSKEASDEVSKLSKSIEDLITEYRSDKLFRLKLISKTGITKELKT